MNKYFEDMLDTFATEGWKVLIEDLIDQKNSINSLEYITSEKDLYYKRGQISILNSLIGFELLVREQMEQTEND